MADDVLKTIGEIGLVPVIKIEDPKDAVPLVKALQAGDLPVAEVTFRTAAAEESIKRINAEVQDMLLGAGTVLSVDQVKKAVAAGAKFIVSPGFNPKVVEYCVKEGIPITPGINNPSGIEAALEYGLKVLKFFPAENSGGLAMLKAMAAPYGGVSFIPTGGVNQNNMASYLAWNKIVAVGGSWMVPADLISAGKFDEITKLTAAATAAVHGFEIFHVGINHPNAEEAMKTSGWLFKFLKLEPNRDGESAIFAGKLFEVMKHSKRGSHGHIGIGVNSVERGLAAFKRKGIGVQEDTIRKDASGNMTIAYLDCEIAGFQWHLSRKG
ncbi:MAG: bifunctional 4-hydroxy-2-oxoglutarate aldolase/2-dehydro-3-deoxy-phosphogluconate aldolase [Spirochaetales bacterium]|jgi:2-dehydro-3-deoxyphosphogluconate aldolase/(4S)-4-hydroxy-2-oxoglutarate aldolase|nr:bifunctional 4-hydroxy-2-oxoglutarate aldolase/2-dehydro-3-deoxy-phosphogluconate aldolase [Spirochaetales bacterium]